MMSSTNRFLPLLGAEHESFHIFDHELTQAIWYDKYRWQDEKHPFETFARVAKAIYQHEKNKDLELEAYEAMCAGLWMPGGRIIAGAGTTKRVTLMNCYVNKTLDDSLDDIMSGVSIAALTQQQGGGIGTDFSTLRPTGAILRRTGATASGPLPFMDMWDSMCATIRSAGDRRGAMMGTMIDTHPDLLNFITAKQKKGKLENFNMSVLVSDAFMEAIREDEEWVLHFPVEPVTREDGLEEYDFVDDKGQKQYAYSVHKARELWEKITKNTYEYSEPGVIFIDRVNALNNLQYCEYIQCTNPCGEQPLPPNGTCNLGAINLARLVKNPYTEKAEFNFELLARLAKLGMRFLDNVIDITAYPLPEQEEEETNKRRTGLGVSGLADALAQLRLRYGTPSAREVTDKIFYTICQAAYEQSVVLAQERGTYPSYDVDGIFSSDCFITKKLDHRVLDLITKHGIRNGVLLTVAPTGTTSILYGDISSGIEPVFAHTGKRNVRQADGTFKLHTTESFSRRFYNHCRGTHDLPPYMVVADDLSIEDHITIQATIQNWVDASVSKTVNVAKSTSYDQFVKVYDLAYNLGCKGCTTYRPSDVRGSILIADGTPDNRAMPKLRPDELVGSTRKIKWPTLGASLYVTVNRDSEGKPFEIFLNCKDARMHDWMVATSLMLTALLRVTNGDVGFIANELMQVQSLHDTAFVRGPQDQNPRNYGSLVALLGANIAYMLMQPGILPETTKAVQTGLKCKECGAFAVIKKEGCATCTNCGHSDCG